ncbi:BamA/TamA family outer membrane protein [Flagellatimonas centrodinii]|uniref:POTRA domain-containing protein n=1 Tax=Flagellatimonas centrodinii TaxID=2806210 RepID=UPI001FED3AC9|nr:POTRA domain-containing protein [Flagellatimonas centrodinii]ULQ47252.1 BamA/TamA family outer membrane protein [Flagellatimonas centrodinii]
MITGGRYAALCLTLALAMVRAEAAAPIGEIRFEGNRITQDVTMLREIGIRVGEPLDEARIEQSRQALQDLGLFRKVEAHHVAGSTGEVVIFTVTEKWYLQAYPRLSANSDGQNSYGAEVRWNNLWGLNHSLRALGRSRDTREAGRGRDISYRLSYNAPFLIGPHSGLRGSLAHDATRFETPDHYVETVEEAELMLTHAYGLDHQASQGWTIGIGPYWRRQSVDVDTAARTYGESWALATQADYLDLRDHVYSETGHRARARLEVADQNLGSDYSYLLLTGELLHAEAIGTRAHQTLETALRFGLRNNGLSNHPAFTLGGTDGLRGYDRRSMKGNLFYLASVQWLRPVIWDSLRAVVGVEIGNVAKADQPVSDQPQISFNAGLRLRPKRLVGFELELGVAFALGGDTPGSARPYGGKVGN